MRWIAGTVVSFFWLQASASPAPTALLLSSSADIESRVSQAVMKEAYKQLDISVSITELPAERALIESNAGRSDGEVNRIEEQDKRLKRPCGNWIWVLWISRYSPAWEV